MLVPIEWLKEYATTDLSSEEIAQKLTFAGLSVEEIKNDVLNTEVTANRSDWLSIYGTARELSAITNCPLKNLEQESISAPTDGPVSIQVADDLILRYSGYLIEGIKVGESPDWLKKRLQSAGIRSINNVVDVTNYIMVETGLPLHAFDADKIINGKLTIRRAEAGEEVVTLDGISRNVDTNNIVAENDDRLIDLVGIMGGELSESEQSTKKIFLQGAVFPPVDIRRSSKTVRLTTEASYRYERGVDFVNSVTYLNSAVNLIIELCGGRVVQFIDILPKPYTPPSVSWTIDKAKSLLGIDINQSRAILNLEKLGIKTEIRKDNLISTPPPWRFDINLPEDIIEEIVRFVPLNDLPRTMLPVSKSLPKQSEYYFEEHIKDILANLGLIETDNYSFVSAKELSKVAISNSICFSVSNPLSEEYEYLRPNLKIGLLKSIAQNPSYDSYTLFEIGHVFPNPNEVNHLGLIAVGKAAETLPEVITQLYKKLNISGKTPAIETINTNILTTFKIRKSKVAYFEIDLKELMSTNLNEYKLIIQPLNQKYQSLSKFPAVRRDLAVIVDNSLDVDDIKQLINDTNPQVKNVELFDRFESPKFGPNKMSIAFHIAYQSDTKTLTDSEADTIHQQVINNLQAKYKAVPRT